MSLRDRIHNNPYRTLGVPVGSPASLELRNRNRIAAFSRVGQQVSFIFPVEARLDAIERTESLADEALRTLALSRDRLANALFWVGDGQSAWSRELNAAIGSLLDGRLLEALCHYGNLLFDATMMREFQQAVTHGLMSLSVDELILMLQSALADDEEALMMAVKAADTRNRADEIIRRLCGESILREIDVIIDLNDVTVLKIINGKKEVDFYESFDRLALRMDELLPLARIVAWLYGKESVIYAETAERIARDIYEKAAGITEAVDSWTWIRDNHAPGIAGGAPLRSARTGRSVRGCMKFVAKVDRWVRKSIKGLALPPSSVKIIYPARHHYEKVLGEVYVEDDGRINKAVRKHEMGRLVPDMVWLAILGLLFFLV